MRAFAKWTAIGCVVVVWILSVAIYGLSLYYAYLSSIVALAVTFFLPILGQLYWIWSLWSTTGVFLNTLTVMCIVWFALAAAGLLLNAYADE